MSSSTKNKSSVKEHRFEAEVSQLLTLLASALYKNKEVFLRELISNASDATDKLRFASVTDSNISIEDDLKIMISVDENKLIIADQGIGMNQDDLVDHLGTIAKSGTKNFLNNLSKEDKDKSELIGQFGVGFYSAFVVADEVEVRTKKAGEEQGYVWISNGSDHYSIDTCELSSNGTTIILHLKDSELEFLEEWRIRQIIKRYSDHISLPVYLEKLVVAEEGEKDKADVTENTTEQVLLNEAKALWSKSKKDVDVKEYNSLYKHLSNDAEDALAWAHHHVEGKLSYISLLYIPKNKPFDLWSREHRAGLKLYVKRVFILDDADHFLPMYLRFVKGVVDSADLPLNVSREMLQDSAHISIMKQSCVKRVLDLLAKMAKDKVEDYQLFWDNFGAVLKEGVAEDFNNKAKLLDLMRFSTTQCKDNAQTVSLADYVSRMNEGQGKIYYCIADSYSACKNSPHLEVFNSNGIEVLLLSDRIDEWLMSNAQDFDGKSFQSVARGDLDFLDKGEKSDSDKSSSTNDNEQVSAVLDRVNKVLDGQVKAVRASSRLTDSAACLVVDDNEMSTNLQRILQDAGQQVPNSKPVLEINSEHPVVKVLLKEASDDRFAALSQVLFDQATLAEGGSLVDSSRYVKNIDSLLREIR